MTPRSVSWWCIALSIMNLTRFPEDGLMVLLVGSEASQTVLMVNGFIVELSW